MHLGAPPFLLIGIRHASAPCYHPSFVALIERGAAACRYKHIWSSWLTNGSVNWSSMGGFGRSGEDAPLLFSRHASPDEAESIKNTHEGLVSPLTSTLHTFMQCGFGPFYLQI